METNEKPHLLSEGLNKSGRFANLMPKAGPTSQGCCEDPTASIPSLPAALNSLEEGQHRNVMNTPHQLPL